MSEPGVEREGLRRWTLFGVLARDVHPATIGGPRVPYGDSRREAPACSAQGKERAHRPGTRPGRILEEVVEMNTENDWRQRLQDDLGNGSEAIREALKDVAEICGPVGWWVDHRNEPKLLVYVLADGVLHRLRGERDPIMEQSMPDQPTTCRCDYEAALVTKDSTCSLTVTRNTSPNSVVGVTRTWTFERLGRFGSIEINHPSPSPGITPGPDPTPFARALAVEIARAGTRAARA